MVESFLRTLTLQCGVTPGQRVLLCCSGGVDSMVLLRLMLAARQRLSLDLHAVTVDHGLRCEAPGDARFVQDTCQSLGVACSLYELGMDPQTPNLEEAARLRRYAAIWDCRAKAGSCWVATGHTLDDQAETLVHRMLRGSGIAGMSGMAYARPDGLIRPMLDITRPQVMAYARAHDIRFVTDQTNHDLTLVRNRIRKKILPEMAQINPGVVLALGRLATIAREEDAYMEAQAATLRQAACTLDWGLCRIFDREQLQAAHPAVVKRLLIRELAALLQEPRGVDAIQIEAVMAVLTGRRRAHTLKRRVRVETSGASLCLGPAGDGPFYAIPISAPGTYALPGLQTQIAIDSLPQAAACLLRSARPGDTARGKRVVRLLAQAGIIEPLRRLWPVIVCRDQVVAVAKWEKSLDGAGAVFRTGGLL